MATVLDRETCPVPEVRQTRMLIGGRWCNSANGKTFSTINPATEEVIAEVAEGDEEDIDRAVAAARDAFESGPWPKMDARDRGKLLNRLADLIEKNSDELAALETLDNGKPIRDSRNVDLPLVINVFRYYAGWADKITATRSPSGATTLLHPPRAGGRVRADHSLELPHADGGLEMGPGPGRRLHRGNEAGRANAADLPADGRTGLGSGLPAGRNQHRAGLRPQHGAALVRHPDVDKIAFTGEHLTAQTIMAEAAPTLKRLTFELGGKSPNVIFADADLDAAAAGAEFGLFINQGQCCCAGSRVFVEEKVHDAFVEKVVERAKSRRLGDPFDPQTTQGPQVDQAQFDKVLRYINRGQQAGAKCLTGGRRHGERGYYVEPTVFDEVEDGMDIARDEIFGPVMSVLRFRDVDEVIQRGNKTFYGLAAAVWTRDVAKAHKFAAGIRAGTVWINCYDVLDPAAPFGGFKMSGIGRELGEAGLANYTELKTVTMSLR